MQNRTSYRAARSTSIASALSLGIWFAAPLLLGVLPGCQAMADGATDFTPTIAIDDGDIEVVNRLLRHLDMVDQRVEAWNPVEWSKAQAGTEPAHLDLSGEWNELDGDGKLTIKQDGCVAEHNGKLYWGIDGNTARMATYVVKDATQMKDPLDRMLLVLRWTARVAEPDRLTIEIDGAAMTRLESGDWLDVIQETQETKEFWREK